MIGGYMLLSLKDKDFTPDTPIKIDGIYDRVEGRISKPIVLGDFSISGNIQGDYWLNVKVNDTTFEGELPTLGLKIQISQDDNVTFITI